MDCRHHLADRNDFLRSSVYFVGWTIDRLLNICLIFTTWLVSDGHTAAAVGVEICKTPMDDDTLDDMVLFPSKMIVVCENSVFVFYCLGLMSVFPYFIAQSDHSRQQCAVFNWKYGENMTHLLCSHFFKHMQPNLYHSNPMLQLILWWCEVTCA